MKKAIVLSLYILSTQFLFAQAKLAEGWLVNNAGDTIQGLIYTREWNNSPNSVTIKTDVEKKYEISEVMAFGLADQSFTFRRFTITRHLTPSNDNQEYPINEDSTLTSMQFLKLLVPGKYALYEFNTYRIYFFYQSHKDSVTELQYSNGIKSFTDEAFRNDPRYGKTMMIENPVYKNQLLQLATQLNLAEYSNKILNSAYSEPQLTSIFELFNRMKRTDKSKLVFKPGIGGGIGFATSSIGLNTTGGIFANASFNSKLYPFLMFNLEMGSSKKFKHTSIIARLQLSKIDITGKGRAISTLQKAIDYKLDNTFIDVSLGGRYKFNPRAACILFADIGINSIFIAKGTNQQYITELSDRVVTKEIAYNSFRVSGFAAWGINFKRLTLLTSYLTKVIHTNYVQGNYSNTRIMVGAYYQLKK
jgi:hypothetical protein